MEEEFLILGTGALATLFAARLAGAGLPVVVLGTWKEGLEALRRNGARLVNAEGTEKRAFVRVTDRPQDCQGIQSALVLVKSWQTRRAALQLKDCLAEDGLALTLQNGLGNRETLAQSLGEGRVAQGITTNGAALLGPGLVKAGGEGLISIEDRPAICKLEQALKAAGFKTETVRDVKSLIWGKLVINAAINPLTALLRVQNGELLERPTARALMRALAEETAAVAKAEKVRLPFEDPAQAAEEVARSTASNHSSMLQDVRRGAPTEIESICGAISRAGQKLHVPTPLNQVFRQLIQALVPQSGRDPSM